MSVDSKTKYMAKSLRVVYELLWFGDIRVSSTSRVSVPKMLTPAGLAPGGGSVAGEETGWIDFSISSCTG